MSTATKMMRMADNNSKVKGEYHGVRFTGVAVKSRMVTTKPYPEELTVELDSPIQVYGREADTVLIYSSDVDAMRSGMKIALSS